MSDYLRFRRATLQTPVHRYTHPDTGRRITAIGMCHVAEPAYYRSILTVIGELETAGAVVYCEGTGPRHGEQPNLSAASGEVRIVHAAVEHRKDLEQRRYTEVGLIHQVEALPPRASWQHVDLTTTDLIHRIGWRKLLRHQIGQIRRLDRPDDPRSIEEFRLSLYRFIVKLRVGMWLCALRARRPRRQTGRKRPSMLTVLIDQRNEILLDAVWRTDQDAVLVWGCAHLPGLQADMVARGFTRTGIDWHTALTLPPAKTIRARIKSLPRATAPGSSAAAPDATTEVTTPHPELVDATTRT